VNGGFRGTTAIHVFEPVGKFSAEVVDGPSTSRRPIQVFNWQPTSSSSKPPLWPSN